MVSRNRKNSSLWKVLILVIIVVVLSVMIGINATREPSQLGVDEGNLTSCRSINADTEGIKEEEFNEAFFQNSVSNLIKKLPADTYLGRELRKIKYIAAPCLNVVFFENMGEMGKYIDDEKVEDAQAFKEELIQVQGVLREICTLTQGNYPFSRIGIKTKYVRRLKDKVEQRLIPIRIRELAFNSRGEEVEYLLQQLDSDDPEFSRYSYGTYLRAHSREYMHEMLKSFDDETISSKRVRIITLLNNWRLNAELENELISRYDYECKDLEVNQTMISTLSWVGDEKTHTLLTDITNSGPLELGSLTSSILERWEFKKSRQQAKEQKKVPMLKKKNGKGVSL